MAQDYLIDKLLPFSQTSFLSGSSGAGKTTWVAWFRKQLQTGEIFGHKVNMPSFMAYIAADRLAAGSLDKLKDGGWDDPPHYDLIQDPGAHDLISSLGDDRIPSTMGLLNRALASLRKRYLDGAQLPEYSLIIIDGMGPMLGIEPSGKYLKQVARPMILTNQAAYAMKCCFLLMHHGIKVSSENKYLRPEDNMLGSMALQGFSSTILHMTEPELTEDPTQNIHQLTVRSHDAPRMTQLFRRVAPNGIFEHVGEGDAPKSTIGAKEKVLRAIPESGFISSKDLRMRAEVSKSTFYEVLAALKEAGKVEHDESSGMIARKTES